jgi:hypothetical protein
MKTVNLGIRTLGTAAVNICVLVILATSPNSTLNLCVMIYNPCIWVRSYEYPNIRDIITETPTSPLTPSSLLAVPLCVLVVRDHPISFSSVWAPRGPNVPGQLLWTSKRRYPVRSGIDGLDFATSSSIRSKAAQATPLPRTPSPSTRGAAAGATIRRRVAEREKIVPLLPLTNTSPLWGDLPLPPPQRLCWSCSSSSWRCAPSKMTIVQFRPPEGMESRGFSSESPYRQSNLDPTVSRMVRFMQIPICSSGLQT